MDRSFNGTDWTDVTGGNRTDRQDGTDVARWQLRLLLALEVIAKPPADGGQRGDRRITPGFATTSGDKKGETGHRQQPGGDVLA